MKRYLQYELRALAAAFTFMTRIPAGRLIPHSLEDLPQSAVWFPLVGAVVGVCGALALLIASQWWSPSVAALISIMVTVRITGAFHEDALADSLDGFGGGQNSEQVMAIMKDSRVGSYALVGMFMLLALKWTLIADLMFADDRGSKAWHGYSSVLAIMIAAHTMGRCSSVWLMRALPYVRTAVAGERASAGKPFVDGVSLSRTIAATCMSIAITVVCMGVMAWVAILVAIVLTALSGRYFVRRIGGITGDALGAANQIVELGIYLIFAAMLLQPAHVLLLFP